MVAGRVGAAMSAEIGTMNVTQQIDALRALAVHPVDYLVVPRAVAMMVSMPLLVAECVFCGIFAGYFASVRFLGVSGSYYMVNTLKFTGLQDIAMALCKGVVFGIPDRFHQLSSGAKCQGWGGRRWKRHYGVCGYQLAGHSDLQFLPDDGAQHCFSIGTSWLRQRQPLYPGSRSQAQKFGTAGYSSGAQSHRLSRGDAGAAGTQWRSGKSVFSSSPDRSH